MRKVLELSAVSLLGFIFSVLLLAAYNNCSPSFKTQDLAIRTSCTNAQKVSSSELYQMLYLNHKGLGTVPSIRCPGFLAVLSEDLQQVGEQKSTNQFKMTAANTLDNCGEVLPPDLEPPITDPTAERIKLIRDLIARADTRRIGDWMSNLSDGGLWPTRFHASAYKRAVPEWIKNEFQTIATANSRADIQIRLVEHTNTSMPSVEAVIPGLGSDKDQFVIIGGHQDSINRQDSRNNPNAIAPGADDNASGVSVVLETFRILVEGGYKPNKTIVFYTYAAEEIGLVGSQEIARSYSQNQKRVAGVLQLDMVMYPTSSANDIYFVTDFTSQNLTTMGADLAKQFLGANVKYMRCGYGCSDHASWSQFGYPSMMPSEMDLQAAIARSDPAITRIHTPGDRFDSSLNTSYGVKFSQLAIAFAISLGQ